MNIQNQIESWWLVDLRRGKDILDGYMFPIICELTQQAVNSLVKWHQIRGEAPEFAIVRNGIIFNRWGNIEPRLDRDLVYSLMHQKWIREWLRFCRNSEERMSRIHSPKNILDISGSRVLTTRRFYDRWIDIMNRYDASNSESNVSHNLGLDSPELYEQWKEIVDDR